MNRCSAANYLSAVQDLSLKRLTLVRLTYVPRQLRRTEDFHSNGMLWKQCQVPKLQ
jgi:hypothetical protein